MCCRISLKRSNNVALIFVVFCFAECLFAEFSIIPDVKFPIKSAGFGGQMRRYCIAATNFVIGAHDPPPRQWRLVIDALC